MRLPLIARSHSIGRVHLSRCHESRYSQAAAAAQHPSIVPRISLPREISLSRPRPPPEFVRGQRSVRSHILLANALDLYRSPSKPLSKSMLAEIQLLAWFKTPELSVLTAQHILRQTPQLDQRISCLLGNDSEREEALGRLAKKGVTMGRLAKKGVIWEDVSLWAWILIPDDPDERVNRLLNNECHKPIFVLFYILNQAPYFANPDSLSTLLGYCEKWYSGPRETVDYETRRSWLKLGMTPIMFCKMLEKLCYHASRFRHHVLQDLAKLAAAYIRAISRIQPCEDRAYKMQCQVFNAALQAVSISSREAPYRNATHNWRALTTLLSLSSSLKRPLVIEKESYRAIRRVLLALPKTDSERDTATTLSASWPPYRIMRDGMEEAASTENYRSRIIKAGIMMRNAGYNSQEIDVVMDILGGMAPDGTPTVQTRARLPQEVCSDHWTWAALIRTTRNTQEAWASFQHPPTPGMKPTFEVYWELVTKLAARPADPNDNNLPGDSREVFPYDDTNLSDFEKARIRPPEFSNVVSEMLKACVITRERHLAWLIRLAPTIKEARRYIEDCSLLDTEVKSSLKSCLEDCKSPPPSMLTNPPREILRAFIELLCRMQPYRSADTRQMVPRDALHRVQYAFRLAHLGWASVKDSPGQPPWESILATLGRPNIMVTNDLPRGNTTKVLLMAVSVMEHAEAHCGLSLSMFNSFRETIQNAVYPWLPVLLGGKSFGPALEDPLMSLYRRRPLAAAVPDQPVYRKSTSDELTWRQHLAPVFQNRNHQDHQSVSEIFQDASDKIQSAWRALATTGPAREPEASPLVTATNINSYMRTLAFLGEYEEMLLLLWWGVREWAPEGAADLSLSDAGRLARAVRAFRAFAEPMLGEEVVAPLREEIRRSLDHKTSNWPKYWPSDEEVVEYIQSDSWGNHQNLHEVLKLAAAPE